MDNMQCVSTVKNEPEQNQFCTANRKIFFGMTALKQTSLWTSINVGGPMEVLKTTNFETMTAISKIIRQSQTITYVPKAVGHTYRFFSFYNINPVAAFVTGILYTFFYIWTFYFIFTSLQVLITLPFNFTHTTFCSVLQNPRCRKHVSM
jgi:hypothetical protein